MNELQSRSISIWRLSEAFEAVSISNRSWLCCLLLLPDTADQVAVRQAPHRNHVHKQSEKTTRVRTVLNEKQLHTLRTCYNANPRPDALMKEQLVEMTGLSPRVIRVWFQNKRCKDKKKSILMKQLQQQQHSDKTVSIFVSLAARLLSLICLFLSFEIMMDVNSAAPVFFITWESIYLYLYSLYRYIFNDSMIQKLYCLLMQAVMGFFSLWCICSYEKKSYIKCT